MLPLQDFSMRTQSIQQALTYIDLFLKSGGNSENSLSQGVSGIAYAFNEYMIAYTRVQQLERSTQSGNIEDKTTADRKAAAATAFSNAISKSLNGLITVSDRKIAQIRDANSGSAYLSNTVSAMPSVSIKGNTLYSPYIISFDTESDGSMIMRCLKCGNHVMWAIRGKSDSITAEQFGAFYFKVDGCKISTSDTLSMYNSFGVQLNETFATTCQIAPAPIMQIVSPFDLMKQQSKVRLPFIIYNGSAWTNFDAWYVPASNLVYNLILRQESNPYYGSMATSAIHHYSDQHDFAFSELWLSPAIKMALSTITNQNYITTPINISNLAIIVSPVDDRANGTSVVDNYFFKCDASNTGWLGIDGGYDDSGLSIVTPLIYNALRKHLVNEDH